MTDLTVQVGAEVDLSTRGARHRTGGDLLGGGRRRPRYIIDTLVPTNDSNQVKMPAGGAAGVLVYPGPPAGEVWHIRSLVWTAGDDHTAVAAASCATYIGTDVAQAMGQLLIPGQAIPGYSLLPDKTVKVHPGERLVMVFYGVAAGVQLGGNMRVEKWRAEDIEASVWP